MIWLRGIKIVLNWHEETKRPSEQKFKFIFRQKIFEKKNSEKKSKICHGFVFFRENQKKIETG